MPRCAVHSWLSALALPLPLPAGACQGADWAAGRASGGGGPSASRALAAEDQLEAFGPMVGGQPDVLNAFRLDVLDAAAVTTDEVVVWVRRIGIEQHRAAVEGERLELTAFDQLVERVVHGRPGHFGNHRASARPDLVGCQMDGAVTLEGGENRPSLGRHPQPAGSHAVEKRFGRQRCRTSASAYRSGQSTRIRRLTPVIRPSGEALSAGVLGRST